MSIWLSVPKNMTFLLLRNLKLNMNNFIFLEITYSANMVVIKKKKKTLCASISSPVVGTEDKSVNEGKYQLS